jgi:hypothetical protein
MDVQKTLKWLDGVCQAALAEGRAGDTLLANRLGQNPALAHYLNNVAARRAISPDLWALSYPPFVKEADRLRQEYERAGHQIIRILFLRRFR